MIPDVTVVVTSCRRHDLLKRTLASFFKTNDHPLAKVIIIEDSDDRGVFDIVPLFADQPIEIILNGANIGQLRSIDKAYGRVESEFIFHIEDDWEFTRPGVVQGCVDILRAEPQTLLVLARQEADMPPYVRSLKIHRAGAAAYKRLFPELHFAWYTFSFNPTMKRRSDYRRLPGGYAGIGGEMALSRHFKAENWDMCWLMDAGVAHIGNERTTYAHLRAKKSAATVLSPASFVKWKESLRRKFWHSLRKLGIDTEQLQRRKFR